MRILLIEDEAALAAPVIEHLEADHQVVDWFGTLEDAEAAVLAVEYDFVLLDLQLPDGNGLSFLDMLRDRRLRVPVIILTARDKVSDRIEGLKRGADDYIIKPFDLDEVTARIQTVHRRVSDQLSEIIRVRDLSISVPERRVFRGEHPISLTAKEWGVLEALLTRKSRIVSKQQLEAAIYGFGEEVESNALEAHISRLRAKLGRDLIVTHRGIGYMLAA